MPNDFAHCVVRHPDGRWFYHLPNAGRGDTLAVLADGKPMVRLSERSPWWAADHEATRITQVSPAPRKITGYKLDDPDTASAKYPAELTPEEWKERQRTALGRVSDQLWELYSSVSIDQDPIEEHIDGPFTVLDGSEPPAPGGPAWTVNLLDSITQRPEYAHLFPGYLTGFREHLIGLIKHLPRVEYCFDGYKDSTAVYVSLKVPFERPETRWIADIGKRGQTLRSGRTVQQRVSRTLYLPVANAVPGDNYAAALAEWDRQTAFWTQIVTDAGVAACNHCRGTGHTPTGSEQYTPAK